MEQLCTEEPPAGPKLQTLIQSRNAVSNWSGGNTQNILKESCHSSRGLKVGEAQFVFISSQVTRHLGKRP